MTGSKRLLCSRLGFLCQFQPSTLPCRLVARFDVLHRSGDIEHVTAALLRLRDKPQCMSAERMIGKEKVEHKRSSITSYSFSAAIQSFCVLQKNHGDNL